MSIEAVTWALNVPVGGNMKVVLLGLANHAHPDGSESYPSKATLAGYANCDPSTAVRNVRKLEADGWVRRDGAGPRGEAKYQLAMGAPFRGDGILQGGAPAPGGGGVSVEGGVAPMPPEPSLEPSKEPSSKNAGAVERVWAHYQATIPNGRRKTLDAGRRLLIVKALKVRDVDECCRAIDGLAASDYHVQNGYLDIKYALLGGGRSPSAEATIDRLGSGNGSQSAGRSATVGRTTGRPSRYDHVIESAT